MPRQKGGGLGHQRLSAVIWVFYCPPEHLKNNIGLRGQPLLLASIHPHEKGALHHTVKNIHHHAGGNLGVQYPFGLTLAQGCP